MKLVNETKYPIQQGRSIIKKKKKKTTHTGVVMMTVNFSGSEFRAQMYNFGVN